MAFNAIIFSSTRSFINTYTHSMVICVMKRISLSPFFQFLKVETDFYSLQSELDDTAQANQQLRVRFLARSQANKEAH